MKKLLNACAVLSLAAFLSGCDSSPSDKDIKSAIEDNIQKSNESLKASTGRAFDENMLTTLYKAKKLGCEDKSSDGSYKCKVDVEAKVPYGGHQEKIAELTFIKDGSSWKVLTN